MRTWRVAVLTGVLLLPTVAAKAASPVQPGAVAGEWAAWEALLTVDRVDLPARVGALVGVSSTRRCNDLTSDLGIAIEHFARAFKSTSQLQPGVVEALGSSAAASLARLVDCMAIHAEHLQGWDPKKLGPVPDWLRAEWVGTAQDLGELADDIEPAATRLAGYTCIDGDPPCLIQRSGGTTDDVYTKDAALLIDEGGNDRYENNAAGGSGASSGGLGPPISLLHDLGTGDDVYIPDVTYALGRPTIGAGYLGGVGILYDNGGSDHYEALGGTMGAGVAGLGILWDQGSGDDQYLSPYEEVPAGDTLTAGQNHKVDHGAAVERGMGILRDSGGNDMYSNEGVDSMGYASGEMAAGLLADRDGHDHYIVTPAHSCAGNNPSDCSDISGVSIGSAENGGKATLIDGGDLPDTYECTFPVVYGCIGAAYDGRLAMLTDQGGDDFYFSATKTTGANAPGAIGAASGLGKALFTDVSGNDTYNAPSESCGWGRNNGVAKFLDARGSDTYTCLDPPASGMRVNGSTWTDGTGAGTDV